MPFATVSAPKINGRRRRRRRWWRWWWRRRRRRKKNNEEVRRMWTNASELCIIYLFLHLTSISSNEVAWSRQHECTLRTNDICNIITYTRLSFVLYFSFSLRIHVEISCIFTSSFVRTFDWVATIASPAHFNPQAQLFYRSCVHNLCLLNVVCGQVVLLHEWDARHAAKIPSNCLAERPIYIVFRELIVKLSECKRKCRL